ncbi:hypothetical protein M271_29985 [Streptomyces rapamycinicus NRRL 5491]|nr:hypothetical protein M271_29985 [Streptomyces rapamycinicus NRRL 5491]
MIIVGAVAMLARKSSGARAARLWAVPAALALG